MTSAAAANQVADVVVPVYGNVDAVDRCLRSVLQSDSRSLGRVIVVDDASPDAETRLYLDRLGDAGTIELLRHPTNRGVVAANNTGVSASRRDVVLLNSDTEVHGDWLDRLMRCAYSADDIGTVTPFSNEGSICSYPYAVWWRGLPGGLTTGQLDRLFAEANSGASAEVPSGVSFCMLVRRVCLDEVGLFDVERYGTGYGDETDFCQRARLAGWRNVVCADAFVFHEGGGSFGADRAARAQAADRVIEELYPGYQDRVLEFVLGDTLRPFRHAVDLARVRRWPDQLEDVLRERQDERDWLLGWLRSSLGRGETKSA